METAEYITRPRVAGVALCRTRTPAPDLLSDTAGYSEDVRRGDLGLTAHHLIFIPSQSQPPTPAATAETALSGSTAPHSASHAKPAANGNKALAELQIQYALVERIEEHKGFKPRGTMVIFHLKTFREICIWFPIDSHATDTIHSVESLRCPPEWSWHFALQAQIRSPSAEGPVAAEPIFSWEEELKLMGVLFDDNAEGTKNAWRVTHVNKDYKMCESYPTLLAVPATVDDTVVELAAKYRQHGRVPIVTYINPRSKMPLLRSSQPLTGNGTKRCYEDEQLLRNVRDTCNCKESFILDVRPTSIGNASRNSKNVGVELAKHYYKWQREFSDIALINTIQDSFNKLLEACRDRDHGMVTFQSGVEASDWLTHVRAVISTAMVVARLIEHKNAAVLVHGGSGWDNTSSVCSLAQMLCEKRFRTMRGLCQLIEKEWLTMGHPFSTRHAHFGDPTQHERAPVFLLFLDCVHQVFLQFPRAFEFNEDFLFALHEHSMASAYTTFYFDNVPQRRDSGQENSLWTYLLAPEQREAFVNPLYDPSSTEESIRASFRPQILDVWREMYCWPWFHAEHPDRIKREDVAECSRDLANVNDELEAIMKELATLEAAPQTSS